MSITMLYTSDHSLTYKLNRLLYSSPKGFWLFFSDDYKTDGGDIFGMIRVPKSQCIEHENFFGAHFTTESEAMSAKDDVRFSKMCTDAIVYRVD